MNSGRMCETNQPKKTLTKILKKKKVKGEKLRCVCVCVWSVAMFYTVLKVYGMRRKKI